MTPADVGRLLAFITAVYPNIDIRDGTVEAWYELLRDLDYKTAVAAVKKVIAESEIPAMPAVGRIRRAALELQGGCPVTAPEAWGMVLSAVRRHGLYGETEAVRRLPPDAARVVKWIGWREICHSRQPDAVRAQFMRMYEQQEKHTREIAILPPGVKELAEKLGETMKLPAVSKSTEKEAI
jgi:hypothetical protein